MKLPRMYTPVKITFQSLRMEGSMAGARFDCDTEVTRLCRRVRCFEDWKWQLVNPGQESTDREILNDEGSSLDFTMDAARKRGLQC